MEIVCPCSSSEFVLMLLCLRQVLWEVVAPFFRLEWISLRARLSGIARRCDASRLFENIVRDGFEGNWIISAQSACVHEAVNLRSLSLWFRPNSLIIPPPPPPSSSALCTPSQVHVVR